MRKSTDTDLKDLGDILEGITLKLTKMPEADLIDVAARLKPVAKHCKVIDEFVKAHVKTKLKGKAGFVLGDIFKAVLALVPTKRLNQKRLKEEEPEIHEAYNEPAEDEKVTFVVR
jgi:hypothetical protein